MMVSNAGHASHGQMYNTFPPPPPKGNHNTYQNMWQPFPNGYIMPAGPMNTIGLPAAAPATLTPRPGFAPLPPQESSTNPARRRSVPSRVTSVSQSHTTCIEGHTQNLKRKLEKMLGDEQMMLFNSDRGDYTIQCGNSTWKVYGDIVFPRCKWLATAAKWKKDDSSNTIDLNDDDPKAVSIFINFLYTRNSDLLALSAPFSNTPIQDMANVAITADKYDQPLLLEQVRIEFGKLTNNSNAYMYENGEERTKDLIRALAKLHSHDGGSKGIQDLQTMILYILKNSQHLRNMGSNVTDVLETVIAEDVRLATLILKYLSGGVCFESPVIKID